tara:strand:- start:10300 stop:11397 length:1098 start_codon:yes stop_codon:yes gene_type:complete
MKNIVFYYPVIYQDGLKTTFEKYIKFFKKKFNIILITNSPKKFFSGKQYSHVKVHNLNNLILRRFKHLNGICCLLKIFRYLNNKSIIFSLDNHYFLTILKIFIRNFKLVIRIPNPIITSNNSLKRKYQARFFSKNPGLPLGRFETQLMRFSEKLIVSSREQILYLKKKYKFSNLILIRNIFEKKITKKKITKVKNIFFIGRLSDSKDPFFFINNLLEVRKKYLVNIHVIGDGELKNRILKLFGKNKSIKFYGHVKKPFEKFYKKIDLFCLTSKFDGTPNVLGEAISYCIPCMAPKNVGNVNELLGNGKFGSIYAPQNNFSFQNVLIKAMQNPRKIERKAQMASKNLVKFSKENTFTKLEKVLRTI